MNDLPASATQWQRKFQYIIAPSLKGEPVLQSTNTDLNIEEVEKAKPDLVFTMNPSDADTLGKWGIKVAVMRSMNADDIKKWSSLVGEIYNRQDRATEYNEYFNTTVRQAEERVSQIPAEQRPKVLYIKYTLMTFPHQIIEYAIREAGGKSVSAISFGQETATGVNQQIIGPEQIVQWDPEIMIVESAQEVAAVYDDARISSVKAVKNKNVYCTPVGAHLWTHEGLEEPLCILWLQNLLYPEKYSRSDLEKDTSAFFREFFWNGSHSRAGRRDPEWGSPFIKWEMDGGDG